MSQNDLVIANQGFPATRADINSALQALGSLSSGTTEPATTYAHMPWSDTTTGILKVRSAANDVWISIGVLDQITNTFKLLNDVETVSGVKITEALPVSLGTLGQVLTVNSGATAGEWATPTPTTISVISTTVVTSAVSSVDLTGFDATKYTSYEIELLYVIPDTFAQSLLMRTSADGGSSYDSGASDYQFAANGIDSDNQQMSSWDDAGDSIFITSNRSIGLVGTGTGEDGVCGVLRISKPDLAKTTMLTTSLTYMNRFTRLSNIQGGGMRDASTATDAVRLYFSSGNIESGTIIFRGIV